MKPVEMNDLKGQMLNTEEAREGLKEADRNLAIVELLHEMRAHANINRAELARRLNVTPSTVTQLETNPGGVKLTTLDRYAAACGVKISIGIQYD